MYPVSSHKALQILQSPRQWHSGLCEVRPKGGPWGSAMPWDNSLLQDAERETSGSQKRDGQVLCGRNTYFSPNTRARSHMSRPFIVTRQTSVLILLKERFWARDNVQQSKKLLSAAEAPQMRHLVKLGTVKQGRTQHRRSNKRA